jgi:hypothetical protein
VDIRTAAWAAECLDDAESETIGVEVLTLHLMIEEQYIPDAFGDPWHLLQSLRRSSKLRVLGFSAPPGAGLPMSSIAELMRLAEGNKDRKEIKIVFRGEDGVIRAPITSSNMWF